MHFAGTESDIVFRVGPFFINKAFKPPTAFLKDGKMFVQIGRLLIVLLFKVFGSHGIFVLLNIYNYLEYVSELILKFSIYE